MYNRAVDFWLLLIQLLQQLQEIGALGTSPKARGLFTQLWGAHQRFFRQMLMAAKVPDPPPQTPLPPLHTHRPFVLVDPFIL